MNRIIIGIFAVSFIIRVHAQSDIAVISSNDNLIELKSGLFSMMDWYATEQNARYDIDLPVWNDPDDFIQNLLGNSKVRFQDIYTANGKYKFKVGKQTLSISGFVYENKMNLCVIGGKVRIDSLALCKILTDKILHSKPNSQYFWNRIPTQAVKGFSKDLTEVMIQFMEENKFAYPPGAYMQDSCCFFVDKTGIATGYYLNSLDYEKERAIRKKMPLKFPILMVNGTKTPYVLSPEILYQKYLMRKMAKDIANKASNVSVIDERLHLYLYDLGYPQIYSGYDDFEYGQELIVKTNNQFEVLGYDVGNAIDTNRVKRFDYNKDGEEDLICTDTLKSFDQIFLLNTYIYQDTSLHVDQFTFTKDLGNGYFAFVSDDSEQAMNDYIRGTSIEEVDTAIRSILLNICYRAYNEFDEVIRITWSKMPVEEGKTGEYNYHFDMYNRYNNKYNYHLISSKSGKEGLDYLKKSVELFYVYFNDPKRLVTDPKTYD